LKQNLTKEIKSRNNIKYYF